MRRGSTNVPFAAFAASALVLVAAAGATVAVAQEATEPAPAPVEGAIVDDAGWWNRARPQIELPTGQPPAPPTPGIPPGSLVVGATAGEPDAVAAVAIDPELADGADVELFELTLREVTDDGANLNGAFAALGACPATGFWLGGENGVWETRPAFDCALGEATGTRAEDGTWTFDLAEIAQRWVDGDLASEGIVLVETAEPPTGFRVVFAGLASLTIGVRAVGTGGDDRPASPPTTSPAPSSGGSSSGSSGSSGSGGGGARPSTGSSPPVTVAVPTTAPTTVPAGSETAAPVPTIAIASGPGSPLGTLPWWTWALLLVALLTSGAAMLALGPLGEPVTAAVGRGVTRALEQRAAIAPEDRS